ncbi:hypothetical protein Tco_0407927 [Tanacetum coccineum]
MTDHLIRRIHQWDTTYQTFYPEQRIEFYSLNDVFVLPNNMAYSVNLIRRTGHILLIYCHLFQVVHDKKFYKGTTLTLENPEQKIRSRRRLFDTPSLVESNSPDFDHIFDIEEQSGEEVRETMTEIMEQYMSKTRGDYRSGVTRPIINQDTHFELKGQFLKKLHDNTFSGSEHEDANEHIGKVIEIVDLFHIPKITQDQIMLQAFPVSLTGAASRWLRNQPSGSITTWEEVILFYNGLDVPTRQILDSKGVIPSKTGADAKIAIQEMAEYS